MTLGIVGNEGSKFTTAGERNARVAIRSLLQLLEPGDRVVSGACHLGGIDIWAIEEAHAARINTTEFAPEFHGWEAYKARNILIAEASDVVMCIAVDRLPRAYSGMKFPMCYHCKTADHVKSGGCWTVKYARKIGKVGETRVVEN